MIPISGYLQERYGTSSGLLNGIKVYKNRLILIVVPLSILGPAPSIFLQQAKANTPREITKACARNARSSKVEAQGPSSWCVIVNGLFIAKRGPKQEVAS